jgi:uncharacterized protein (DUF2267 family)
MSATGLDVFDKTLQTTNIWLKEIAEEIGPDRQRAYHALGAVLRALRDRLTIDEAAQLSAQLPLLIRGIYFDQWRPAEQPKRVRHLDDFLAMIAESDGEGAPIDPEDAARAVFKVLGRHIARGEADQLKAVLPAEIRSLWP